MKVILEGDGKEIADFVLKLQIRQIENYYGIANKGSINCHNFNSIVEDDDTPEEETNTFVSNEGETTKVY